MNELFNEDSLLMSREIVFTVILRETFDYAGSLNTGW